MQRQLDIQRDLYEDRLRHADRYRRATLREGDRPIKGLAGEGGFKNEI